MRDANWKTVTSLVLEVVAAMATTWVMLPPTERRDMTRTATMRAATVTDRIGTRLARWAGRRGIHDELAGRPTSGYRIAHWLMTGPVAWSARVYEQERI